MKIKTEALLGAVMLGLVVQVVYTVISTLSLYNSFNSGDLSQTSSPLSSALSLVGCCVFLLTGIGVGLLYVYLHNREEDASQIAVKGGALSGAISYGVGGIISSIIYAIALVPIMNDLMAKLLSDPEFAGAGDELLTSMSGVGLVGGIIGLFCGVIISVVIGTIMGAIGGAIGGSVFKPSAKPPVEFDIDNF